MVHPEVNGDQATQNPSGTADSTQLRQTVKNTPQPEPPEVTQTTRVPDLLGDSQSSPPSTGLARAVEENPSSQMVQTAGDLPNFATSEDTMHRNNKAPNVDKLPSLAPQPPAMDQETATDEEKRGTVVPTTSANVTAIAWNSCWVFLGILLMIAGTLVVHTFLLPKIYTCPDGATCQHNFDPTGNITPRLQTLMQYWLQFGITVAGFGLKKLMAYNSYFILKETCTVGFLQSNIRAVDGSLMDALLQVTILQTMKAAVLKFLKRVKLLTDPQIPPIQHGVSLLGMFALLYIGMGLFISLVVGFSINSLRGTTNVYVPFSYHNSFSLPHNDLRFFSNDEFTAIGQLDSWLRPPLAKIHPTTVFDGTLVLRDNRTVTATNPRPTGSRITGEITCSSQGWNVSLLSTDSPYFQGGHTNLTGVKAYNLSTTDQWYGIPGQSYVAYSYASLASKFVSDAITQDSVTIRQYLWASNTSSVIPNATASHDGGMYYAVCNHTVRMVDLPAVNGINVQTIIPSQPIIYSNPADPNVLVCPSKDPLACVAWSVDHMILAWYQINAVSQDLIPFSCLSGVLAAFADSASDVPDCNVTSGRWEKTVITGLDAMITTAHASGNTTQYLSASAVSISTDRWWIQLVFPGLTFILYFLCIGYALYLSNWYKSELKEIDLPLVIYQQRRKFGPSPSTTDIHNTEISLV